MVNFYDRGEIKHMTKCCMAKQECHVTLNAERWFGATTELKQQKVPKLQHLVRM